MDNSGSKPIQVYVRVRVRVCVCVCVRGRSQLLLRVAAGHIYPKVPNGSFVTFNVISDFICLNADTIQCNMNILFFKWDL